MATPVLANGQIYTVVWDVGTVAIGGNQAGHYPYFAQCEAEDGSNPVVRTEISLLTHNNPFIPELIVTAPVLAPLKAAVSGKVVEGVGLDRQHLLQRQRLLSASGARSIRLCHL